MQQNCSAAHHDLKHLTLRGRPSLSKAAMHDTPKSVINWIVINGVLPFADRAFTAQLDVDTNGLAWLVFLAVQALNVRAFRDLKWLLFPTLLLNALGILVGEISFLTGLWSLFLIWYY